MSEVRLTQEGVLKYEERLEYLMTVRRAEIAEQIKVARAFGDISENAEYDAAKTEQARNEHEIEEIKLMLRNAVIIDEDSIDTNVVSIGAIVRIRRVDTKDEFEFQIVGSAEADPEHMRISDASPVGKALIGHGVLEIVEALTPGGTIRYEILSISK
ncbi:MAG: Transcription elongation factor GreA [Firmicutes bacterium ADurb.Bin182]|nr:MAG: Transcription elongation factor GreA [Firmicutes bacterium ADurb.Bin182]